jgi:alkylation response protein AidB-like acyl-CoA dehydrogenase
MDFAFTDEQEQLRRSIREFAEAEIRPHVMEWDEKSEFPLAIIKQLGKMGVMGMVFPAEYGGAGLGYVDYVIAVEELSRVDGSVGIIVAAHNSLASNHIYLAGTEEQKRKYIPKLANGEFIGAWGLTEPGSGSDAGSARMTATRKGNSWVLNGTKTFITNGHYADVSVIIAVTDRTTGTHGLSAFIVEKDTKGFRPGKKENKLGLRASDTAELIFEDCAIPLGNLLGKEGDGFIDAMRVLDGGRISIGIEVLQRTQAVRQSHWRIPGHPVETSRHGHRDRCRPVVDPARRFDERCRPEDHAGVVNGETVCQRSCRALRERGCTDSRRLRLH